MRPDDEERLRFAAVDAGMSDELTGVDVGAVVDAAEAAGKNAVNTGNAVVTGLAVEAKVELVTGGNTRYRFSLHEMHLTNLPSPSTPVHPYLASCKGDKGDVVLEQEGWHQEMSLNVETLVKNAE